MTLFRSTIRPIYRIRLVCALMAVAVFLAAGCSSAASDSETAAPSKGTEGSEAEESDQDESEQVETVRYAAAGSPETATFDPHGFLPAESDLVRMALTYDPLTVFNADGEVEPRLAESWEFDESLTTWTLSLRTDAKFTSGEPVTANDALYSLRRMDEKKAENFGRMSVFDLEASSVVDDNTLELRTVRPYAEVPSALAGWTFVVPEGSTDFAAPDAVAGSGPFSVASGDSSVSVHERNDGWWGPEPPTSVIEVRAIADPQARASAVLSGEVDWAAAVPPASAKQAENEDINVVLNPGSVTYPLVMRTDTAPFDDPNVREAVRIGLDRDELLETVFLGYGTKGNDLLTPLDISAPNDLGEPEKDIDEAKRLIDEAGAGDVEVELFTSDVYPGMDTAATLIAEQLNEIGMNVKVQKHPADTYFIDVYGSNPFYVSYLGGIPFTDVFRVALDPASPANETAWLDEDWHAKMSEALATADDAERQEALGELQAELAQDGGYAVWAMSDRIDLTAPGLSGVPKGVGVATIFIDQVSLRT